MIDIVTVVFESELDLLRQQARSISLYCKKLDVGIIRVIVNDQDSIAELISRDWWEEFSTCVEIIPRSQFQFAVGPNGWVDQQILKLLGSSISSNKWNMVLDAKTIIIKELIQSDIFDSQDRCRAGTLSIPEVFTPSNLIVNQLFNIDLKQQIGPGGVPFFLHTQTVQHLISFVESSQKESFATWFQTQGRLTEFILYAGFVKYQHGSFDNLYSVTNSIFPCNVCHSEVESFDRKFKEMPVATTVSIHRNAWSNLSVDQQKKYLDFLHNRGIQ
jgi:hypothetical protein